MNRQINLNISDATGKRWDFDNIETLVKFIENEVQFWNKAKEGIKEPHQYLTHNNNQLKNTISTIQQFQANENSWDDNRFRQEQQALQRNTLSNFGTYWIWSKHDYIPAWIEACKVSKNTGVAFLQAIKDNQANQQNNYDSLKGYILAYEFQMQGKSELTQRKISEEKSFEGLRDRLDTKTNELIAHVDEFEQNIDSWQSKTIDYTKKAKRVNTKLLHRTQKKRTKEFNDYMASAKSQIEELENTYQEKLRLEKPAAYWNTKASEYKTQGNKWAKILAWILGIGFFVFGTFFIMWIKSIEIGLTLNSMQGAVIFATVIAIYAYLVRSITKMVFSSFHLQRDAEEREQLTHVYLALSNENGAIDEDSRKIVLQALFSRADSGLLHKDSSPTMPGMITDFVKMTGGK